MIVQQMKAKYMEELVIRAIS